MKLRCLGAPECADLAPAAPQLKRAVIRFGRRSSRGDIVGGIDFALAIDLAGLRIDETEAVQDHFKRSPQQRGRFNAR